MRRGLTKEQACFLTNLVLLYGDALKKYAVRFVGYRPHLLSLAEDAVQDTYVKAIQNIDELMTHTQPQAWLKICLKHNLLNTLRLGRTKCEIPASDLLDLPYWEACELDEALTRLQDKLNTDDFVAAAQRVLNPEEMKVFDSYFLHSMSMQEAAELEGLPFTTVRGRIRQVRLKLKQARKNEF